MNQIRRGGWYLLNCFSLLLIRWGWLESPSLSVLGETPDDYEAHVTADGISWVPKRKGKDG